MSLLQKKLVSLPRWMKRITLLSTDVVLLIAALWLSFSLRLGVWYWPPGGIGNDLFWLVLLVPVVAIPIFIRFGLYRAIIRYLGMRAAWSVVQGGCALCTALGAVGTVEWCTRYSTLRYFD